MNPRVSDEIVAEYCIVGDMTEYPSELLQGWLDLRDCRAALNKTEYQYKCAQGCIDNQLDDIARLALALKAAERERDEARADAKMVRAELESAYARLTNTEAALAMLRDVTSGHNAR